MDRTSGALARRREKLASSIEREREWHRSGTSILSVETHSGLAAALAKALIVLDRCCGAFAG